MPEARRVVKVVGLLALLGGASYAWVRIAEELREEIGETWRGP